MEESFKQDLRTLLVGEVSINNSVIWVRLGNRTYRACWRGFKPRQRRAGNRWAPIRKLRKSY